MDDTNYYENMIAGLRADIEQADKASAQLECMYNTCCEERTELRAERDALADEVRDLDIELSRARAERDALRQQQADDAESLTAAANTIRELRAERNNWHVAADIELAKAITAEAELRGCTENLDDSCATLAKVEAERDALRALLDRVLSCTDLRGWNGAKAELLCADIDAALKDKL